MKTRLIKINQIAAILIIMIGYCFQTVVQAQLVTPEENKGVLNIQQFDTRSLSLGSATVSDQFGRTSIGINPALSGLYSNDIVFQAHSNHNWNTNLMQHSLIFPTIPIQNHRFTVRIGLLNQSYYQFDFFGKTELPEPDVKLYHADVAYAYAISDVFSVGVLQSLAYTFNDDAQYWTYFADFGLIYAPAENISYGMVFRGIGHESNYEIIETGVTTLGSQLMQQSFELGATFRFPIENRTFMSLSLANEKRFGENGIWYKGGLELLPTEFLAVRGGILLHFGQSRYIPRTGLGLNFKHGSLNYMIAPYNWDGEYFHQLGLTFQF